ncbi:ribosomal protein S7 domain-containing protein [Lentinula edodes]|uniref:Ribosomal protein S7 domain-containing protein n=1 Tax=Lentinula lateritia TaxID=40482 RepID=A0A9W9DHM6_9AGAR|nr:ribosomal protein S7 domain-containing protein [Lentinula edodes]
MATRSTATRLSTHLPAFKQTWSRPLRCSRPALSSTYLQTPSYHSRRSWVTSGPLDNASAETASAENRAFDVLLNDSGPSSVIGSADSDLDIELPSSVFEERSSQPVLINIPPQQDPLLEFLASRLMNHGHRAKATRIVSRTLLNIHAYTRAPPLPILREAIFALAPAVRLLKHRHSTKTIYRPVALSEKQGIWFAVHWLLKECEGRQGGPMIEERLAREIIKIVKGESKTLEKKEEMHKMAMVNRGNIGNRTR